MREDQEKREMRGRGNDGRLKRVGGDKRGERVGGHERS